jgi:hypothetical protein
MDGANFELLLPICERSCAVTIIGRVLSAFSNSLVFGRVATRRSPARFTHKVDMQQTLRRQQQNLRTRNLNLVMFLQRKKNNLSNLEGVRQGCLT